MPPRRSSRGRRAGLTEALARYLETGAEDTPGLVEAAGLALFRRDGEVEFWREHRDAILADFVQANPGRRPWAWWKLDSPEPRKRLGGQGDAFPGNFRFGLPTAWITPGLLRSWRGGSLDVHGRVLPPIVRDHPVTAVALDPDDPPTFESEAAYLDRLGLLLPGERRRLRARDFEPEALVVEPEPPPVRHDVDETAGQCRTCGVRVAPVAVLVGGAPSAHGARNGGRPGPEESAR